MKNASHSPQLLPGRTDVPEVHPDVPAGGTHFFRSPGAKCEVDRKKKQEGQQQIGGAARLFQTRPQFDRNHTCTAFLCHLQVKSAVSACSASKGSHTYSYVQQYIYCDLWMTIQLLLLSVGHSDPSFHIVPLLNTRYQICSAWFHIVCLRHNQMLAV